MIRHAAAGMVLAINVFLIQCFPWRFTMKRLVASVNELGLLLFTPFCFPVVLLLWGGRHWPYVDIRDLVLLYLGTEQVDPRLAFVTLDHRTSRKWPVTETSNKVPSARENIQVCFRKSEMAAKLLARMQIFCQEFIRVSYRISPRGRGGERSGMQKCATTYACHVSVHPLGLCCWLLFWPLNSCE